MQVVSVLDILSEDGRTFEFVVKGELRPEGRNGGAAAVRKTPFCDTTLY
jgi:hypothetical protein|eukprot:COSAG06_NODE_4603_length_4108_cov_3.910950_4_plen_49_part_00